MMINAYNTYHSLIELFSVEYLWDKGKKVNDYNWLPYLVPDHLNDSVW